MLLLKNTEDWIQFFLDVVPREVTNIRWQHCLKVAGYAERLSISHGYAFPRKAYLAGIVHDITKQKKQDFHIELFGERRTEMINHLPVESFHAFSAPFYLTSNFGFDDEVVFSAIRTHTLGNSNLSLIQKILYASDFLGSEFAARQKDYSSWVSDSEAKLEFGVYLKASKTLNNLIENKSRIYEATIDTFNSSVENLNK